MRTGTAAYVAARSTRATGSISSTASLRGATDRPSRRMRPTATRPARRASRTSSTTATARAVSRPRSTRRSPRSTSTSSALTIEVGGDWVMKASPPARARRTLDLRLRADRRRGTASCVVSTTSQRPRPITPFSQLIAGHLLGETGLAEHPDATRRARDVSVAAPTPAPFRRPTPTAPRPCRTSTVPPVKTPTTRAARRRRAPQASLRHARRAAGSSWLTSARPLRDDLRVPAGGINCEIPVDKTCSVPIADTGSDVTFHDQGPDRHCTRQAVPVRPGTTSRSPTSSSSRRPTTLQNPPRMNIISGTGPKGEVGTVSGDKQSITLRQHRIVETG